MLALGKVGKPASGYGCLTGQGNGQGGREHGQKADQLPGYRLIEEPEHRKAIAARLGHRPERAAAQGQERVRAAGFDWARKAAFARLLVFGSNVGVASPNATNINNKLAQLDLLVVCDAFLNETCENAHVVLPIAQWGEEEGTMTNLEGRVILRQRVRPAPPGVKTDIEILCALAQRLGIERGFSFASSEAVFDELRRATRGRQGRLQRHRLRQDPQPARRVLAVPRARPSGHAAPVRRALRVPVGPRALQPGAVSTRGRGAGRRLPAVLHDRALQGALQHRRADSPGRAAARRQARASACKFIRAWRPVWASRKASSCWSRAGAAACRSGCAFRRIFGQTRCSRRFTGAAARPPTC